MRRRKSRAAFGVRLVTLVVLSLFFASCASGSPGVVRQVEPTPTTFQIAAAFAQTEPAATSAATVPATATDPVEAGTPTPAATARPEPPEIDGSGKSQFVDRGTSSRREVALTFDAGADRGFAGQILDTLAEYEVQASFGMTGHWAEENPELVQRMIEEGHMIFNHTWTHRSFTGYSTGDWDPGVLTFEERKKEIDDTAIIIADLTGGYDVAPYFRPPYGDIDDGVLEDLYTAGYWVTVMWSCDSFGWNGATVDEIVERCGTAMAPGDIILMHVGAQSLDAEALAPMIESLQSEEFALVTIEELLQPDDEATS